MLLALAGLVAMFDFIELLRRSTSLPDATFGIVSQIAALRLPYVAMQILPFAVLLGGILCFWRLTRSSELIVARASGVSAWEFLAAPTLCALMLGVVATALVSPVSSVMLARAEALENSYLRSGGGPLALNGGQLWLRQSDRMLEPQGVAIIHAHGVELHGKKLSARDVTVLRLDGADRLLTRIEAARATLGAGNWQLESARTVRPDQLPEPPQADRPAYRSHRQPRAGEFRVARYIVGLGVARLHRAARSVGIFLDPPPAAFPGVAGAAASGGDDDTGVRRASRCGRRAAAGWRK